MTNRALVAMALCGFAISTGALAGPGGKDAVPVVEPGAKADVREAEPDARAGGTRSGNLNGYPVDVNIELVNSAAQFGGNFNPQHLALIIVSWCNATATSKTVEARVGMNAGLSIQDTVASETGTDRVSVTFVVPWHWHFRIVAEGQNPGQAVPGMVCKSSAWTTY